MKYKKGMTLIEVIVAIFLIGLIASSFLPSIMSSFAIMKKGKELTVNVFKTQQNIELSMEEIRDEVDEKLVDPTKTDPRDVPITVFGKTIKGTTIKEPIVNGTGYIYTLIANGHVVEENLPVVSSIKLDQSVPNKIEKPKYVQGANANIKLEGNHDMASMSNYFTDLKKWYVSNDGFDGFIPETVSDESNWGTRYPSWPNDYTIIKNIDSNILTMDSKYIGKHIVYSVIPVSKTGRYGLEKGSNPIYVNGPPILNNLSLHLDTYVLDYKDGEFFKSWNDISGNNRKALALGAGIKLGFNDGKYAEFNKEILTLDNYITRSEDITMFVVLRNPVLEPTMEREVMSKSDNDNGWNLILKNGKLQFNIKNGNRSIISENNVDQNTHIVSIKATRKNIIMTIDKNGIKENKKELEVDSSSDKPRFNYNVIRPTIGNISSALNIAEIIFYSSSLSDDNIDEVRNYLAKKHRIELATELTP